MKSQTPLGKAGAQSAPKRNPLLIILMNLKTHQKLMLGVTTCNVFTMMLGCIAIALISSGYQNTRSEAGDSVRTMNALNTIVSGAGILRSTEYQYLLANSDNDRNILSA